MLSNSAAPDATPRATALAGVRDDRILPETRALGFIIPPFLLAAFLILYLFPDRTQDLFAWGVKPPMTPLLMGGGYISGGYYFLRVLAKLFDKPRSNESGTANYYDFHYCPF